jgi:hypothetical protein
MHRLSNPSARPALEALEGRDVPSYLAAEFPGQGVWRYESAAGAWTQLTTNNASQVAADTNGDVVAAFPGQGVWLCTRDTAWRQLTAANAASLDVAYSPYGEGSDWATGVIAVVAEFPGQGLWRFSKPMYKTGQDWSLASFGGGWIQLTANDATTEAVDQNGNVAAAFRGAGVWLFQEFYGPGQRGQTPWQQLTAADASGLALRAVMGGPPIFLAAEFPGHGVWRYQLNVWNSAASGWQQLTASDAATVGIDQFGDVVAEFPGWGVWSFLDSAAAVAAGWHAGWNQLTAADAALVGIDTAGNAYGQFPGWGVWYDQAYSWQCLTPSNASSIDVAG